LIERAAFGDLQNTIGILSTQTPLTSLGIFPRPELEDIHMAGKVIAVSYRV
jgi:hypothetical protein